MDIIGVGVVRPPSVRIHKKTLLAILNFLKFSIVFFSILEFHETYHEYIHIYDHGVDNHMKFHEGVIS